MADSLIIRDAVKSQWHRDALLHALGSEFNSCSEHSKEALAAWEDEKKKGGILLIPTQADQFCRGFDVAMKTFRNADRG